MASSSRTRTILCVLGFLTICGCTSVPRRRFISARQADYFASHREVSPAVAQAVESGHLLIGMDAEQVWVVLGDPAQKRRFPDSGLEVWIYGPGRLHQDQLHSHGNESFRVVFIKNRLVLIETL